MHVLKRVAVTWHTAERTGQNPKNKNKNSMKADIINHLPVITGIQLTRGDIER
jgi:hypothetical protein